MAVLLDGYRGFAALLAESLRLSDPGVYFFRLRVGGAAACIPKAIGKAEPFRKESGGAAKRDG